MGIFDNATSVVIGNKEVQSIVRVSDGAVLYQKAQTHSYALAFSSATYQTDSSGDVTVSVTLTDNGVPVSGESVSFSDGSSLYTGITNNNGVASLNYNCQTNKTLTASYSNASASCSIISNYVPPVQTITFNIPLSSYTLTDPNGILVEEDILDGRWWVGFADLTDVILDSDALPNWKDYVSEYTLYFESLTEVPFNLDPVIIMGASSYYDSFIPCFITDDWESISYELEFEAVDEDTVIAKVTNNILEIY